MTANDFTSPGYVAAKKVRVPYGQNRAARRRSMRESVRANRKLAARWRRARGF